MFGKEGIPLKENMRKLCGIAKLNIFKKYRTEKNYTLDEVCSNLKYSRRIIEAIERDETNFMESPFNYYCAKNYSEYLGFTIPKEVIAKFK